MADNHNPKVFTLHFGHLKSLPGKISCSLPMLEPIQRASVFLLFSLRPETLLKSFSILSAQGSVSLEPFKISVVSSTYWLILISLLSTEMPFMLTLFLTALANTSAERINR